MFELFGLVLMVYKSEPKLLVILTSSYYPSCTFFANLINYLLFSVGAPYFLAFVPMFMLLPLSGGFEESLLIPIEGSGVGS